MFSNVNQVINTLKRVDDGIEQPFYIDGDNFCYADTNKLGNSWEYYYDQPFDNFKLADNLKEIDVFAWEFITPRNYNMNIEFIKKNIKNIKNIKGLVPLLPPENRIIANEIIKKYLILKPILESKINKEIKKYLPHDKICVHCRGIGKNDGGSLYLNYLLEYGLDSIPYQEYYRAIDNLESSLDILLFTDSNDVINEFVQKYGKRIYVRDAIRTDFGEPHITAREQGLYQLGEDVLIDAYLMSESKYFVHGISNVANFVLANNPNINSFHIYEKFINMQHIQNIYIYQPGKVGSSAIKDSLESLKNKGIINNLHHFHLLSEENINNRMDELESYGLDRKEKYYSNLKNLVLTIKQSNPSGNVFVVGIREPISRAISIIWKNLNLFNKDKRLIDNQGNLIIDRLYEIFMDEYNNERLNFFSWNEYDFKPFMGMDISNLNFDKTKGYGITNTKFGKVLLYKFESLSEMYASAMAEITGIENLELQRVNVSEKKEFDNSYTQAKNTFKLNDKLLNEIYSKYNLKHFYNDKEIDSFISKWTQENKSSS